MGGLLGEPLELVKCETSDVLVPAHAEMVIEAEILPRERTAEGPFGEFTGYSLGAARARGREGPRHHPPSRRVLPGHHGGAPRPHAALHDPDRGQPLPRGARDGAVGEGRARARRRSPATSRSSSACAGQAKNAILAVLGADLYMKRVVVVDHDVDVFDDRQMNWAIATRASPIVTSSIVTPRARLRPRPLDAGGRLLGQVGRRRHRQAVARRLHAAAPRPARRAGATRSEGVSSLAIAGAPAWPAELRRPRSTRARAAHAERPALVWAGGALTYAVAGPPGAAASRDASTARGVRRRRSRRARRCPNGWAFAGGAARGRSGSARSSRRSIPRLTADEQRAILDDLRPRRRASAR